jgi:hypothetical protein
MRDPSGFPAGTDRQISRRPELPGTQLREEPEMESRDLKTTYRRRPQGEATVPGPFTAASSCSGCGRRLRKYGEFVDPRADINVYDYLSAVDHGMAGPDVPACFPCLNDREPYGRVLAAAMAMWHPGSP